LALSAHARLHRRGERGAGPGLPGRQGRLGHHSIVYRQRLAAL
jgi:hypothetical protein